MQEKKLTGYPSIDKPWLKYYKKTIRLEKSKSIYEHYLSIAKSCPDEIAFIDYRSGYKLTHDQLLNQADLLALSFIKNGFSAKSMIGLLGFNCSVDPIALLAVNKIGATLKFVDPDNNPMGMASNIVGLDLLILENVFLPLEPIINTKGIPVVIYGEHNETVRENCVQYDCYVNSNENNQLDSPATIDEADSPAVIIYSSGSTGVAKPIVHSNRTILSAVEKMLSSDFPICKDNVIIKAIPSHIGLGSITTMTTSLLSGMTYIQLKGLPEPVEGLANDTVGVLANYKKWMKENELDSSKGLLLFAAPYFADFIVKAIDTIDDLSFVKGILLGGAKMEKESLDSMELVLNQKGLSVPICNGYGQNEMAGAVALNTVHHNKNGSAGYPVMDLEIKVVDRETLEEVPYNQTGLIVEQSTSAFLRYHNLNELTAKTRIELPDKSIWYDSNDLGYIDEDGFIFITGRTNRVIIRADHKISLTAIEEKINTLDMVESVAVVSNTKNNVVVFVCTNMDKETIETAIKSTVNLTAYEMPDIVLAVNEIPRMNNGKVDYQTLEKEAERL